MPRARQSRKDGAIASQSNDIKYFRRCHICGALCETKDDHVHRCHQCDKPFAKFQYYDDRFTAVYADSAERPHYKDSEYIPIQGLTVHWEPF